MDVIGRVNRSLAEFDKSLSCQSGMFSNDVLIWLLRSFDNDEIPNFERFDFKKNQDKILIFKQKLFYYKFNLLCDRIDWYGTKGCKKKLLHSCL